MNVSLLVPTPTERELFRLSRLMFVPDVPGCYALTSFTGTILYVGLSQSLNRRMREHLDNIAKTRETIYGKATFFYWEQTIEIAKLERTWLNSHELAEGRLPILNLVRSPIST